MYNCNVYLNLESGECKKVDSFNFKDADEMKSKALSYSRNSNDSEIKVDRSLIFDAIYKDFHLYGLPNNTSLTWQ